MKLRYFDFNDTLMQSMHLKATMEAKHIPHSCTGIYAIVNIKNNKRYIGSSIDMRKRCLGHRYNLRKGKHHSAHLQRAWNIDSESSFIFVVLEKCEEHELIAREQFYIDALADYNSSPTAGSVQGMKQTQATKNKHSTRMKVIMEKNPEFVEHITTLSKGRPKSDNWKEKMSKRLKGVKKSESQVEKMAKARAELSEEQVLEICDMRKSGISVAAIAKQKGIGFCSTQRLLDGKSYRWVEGIPSVEELHALKLAPSKRGDQKVYSFYHQTHGVRNCTKRDLLSEFPIIDSAVLSGVCSGSKKSIRGWTLVK